MWTSQSPQKHTRTPKKFPKAGLSANFCRNPDGHKTIWCYTTDPKKRWEECAPRKTCPPIKITFKPTKPTRPPPVAVGDPVFNFGPEKCSGVKCSGYRGRQTKTRSGKTCQRWDAQSPHKHSRTSSKYPRAGLWGNVCRNPDNVKTIWCYTTDSKKRWEYCDPIGVKPTPV